MVFVRRVYLFRLRIWPVPRVFGKSKRPSPNYQVCIPPKSPYSLIAVDSSMTHLKLVRETLSVNLMWARVEPWRSHCNNHHLVLGDRFSSLVDHRRYKSFGFSENAPSWNSTVSKQSFLNRSKHRWFLCSVGVTHSYSPLSSVFPLWSSWWSSCPYGNITTHLKWWRACLSRISLCLLYLHLYR